MNKNLRIIFLLLAPNLYSNADKNKILIKKMEF